MGLLHEEQPVPGGDPDSVPGLQGIVEGVARPCRPVRAGATWAACFDLGEAVAYAGAKRLPVEPVNLVRAD